MNEEGTPTKTCFKCGRTLPITEFYKHKQMADGHLNKCKDCTRKDVREREQNDPMAILKSRVKTCKTSPDKRNARRAVEAAINAGVLVRPDHCMGCGCPNTEHRIEAHHSDYSKPLDVIWLCTQCHREMDARRRVRLGLKPYGKSK